MKLLLILLVLCIVLMFIPCYAEVKIDIQKIIMIESSGDPQAISKSGCIGLMGINPKGALADWNLKIGMFGTHYKNPNAKTISELEIVYGNYYNLGDLYNPTVNVKIGTWYINERIPQMLKAYGIEDTIDNRLIAYHDGVGNLRKYLRGERKLGKFMKGYLRKYKE